MNRRASLGRPASMQMAGLLAIVAASFALSSCRREDSADLPRVRSIAEIEKLSLVEAAGGVPAEIEGFIAFHSPQGHDSFVCDSDACVVLDFGKVDDSHSQDIESLVRVRGTTAVVDHRRAITAIEVQVIGQIDLTQADPPASRIGEVARGKHDAMVVSARGQVRGFRHVERNAAFTLVTESLHVPVLHRCDYGGYPPVSDGEVRVLGVAVASHDAAGNVTGARLLISRCSAVKVLREGPEDLFAGDVRSTAEARTMVDQRVLVRGALRASAGQPTQYSVEDATGSLSILPVEPPNAHQGDSVVAMGYPERQGETLTLTDALLQEQRPAPPPPATTELPTLTTVAEIRHLSAAEARRGYPLHVRAVVTYTQPQTNQFFVQDETGGIYVEAWRHLWEIPSGSRVDIVGRTEPGLFAPIITHPHITVIGAAPLPVPEKVSFDDLMTGSHDSQWVEVEGLVRRVRSVGRAVQFEVLGIGLSGRLPVTIPNVEGPAPKYLVDSRVRVRGVCAFTFNNQRQPISVRIQAPDLSAVTVLEPAPADPFSIGATSIADLLRFDSDRGLQHRVRVRGVVTLHVPGRFVYIQDGDSAVMVTTEQDGVLNPGDVIDAVGFPGPGRAAPEVAESIFRVSGKVAPPAARPWTPERVYDGDGDSSLVTMRGRVVNRIATGGEQILTIRDRSFLISAHLHQSGPVPTSWPEVDALVDVTGICSVQEVSSATIIGQARPQSFRLLLRSSGDIHEVEAPPWWTRGRVLAALFVVTSVLVFSWLWLVALQRTVRQQTAVIQAKLAREAALEERYRKLFESAHDIVLTLSLDGRIASLNRAGRDLFGLSTEQASARRLADLVVPGHEDRAAKLLAPSLPEDAVVVTEIDVVAQDAQVRTLEVSSRPVWEDSRVQGFQGIARDVTERKQAEQQILAFTAKLEQSNAQLQSFADVASHDLQEPLRKVRAFADKLGTKWEQLSHEEIVDLLHRMQGAAQRMQALITQLLSYARLGNVQPALVPVDLSALARDVLEDLEARIEQTGGQVEVGELPTVMGDATQLRQLLQNLVGNALKFAAPGKKPFVRVFVADRPRDGGEAFEIAVQDNGIGFEQKEADRVFQAFYRLHSRQQYEGTGLGLAICQRIVERHGGKIHANSTPGAGTTFLFTLTPALATASLQ